MIRFFDILFSGIAIIILLPFMIPIMIGLKLTGEHDIFYVQERIGKGGKPFGVLKFATMLRNSPNMAGGVLTQKNDPRILPMGNFLRKTKNRGVQVVKLHVPFLFSLRRLWYQTQPVPRRKQQSKPCCRFP